MKTLFIILLIIGFNIGQSANCTPRKKSGTTNVQLAVYYPLLNPGDNMVLWYTKHHTFSQQIFRDYDTISIPIQKSGWYVFEFNIESTSAIFLGRENSDTTDLTKRKPSNQALLVGYYSSPGDNVKITISEDKPFEIDDTKNLGYKFSGVGALKYNVKNQVDSVGHACIDTTAMLTSDDHFNSRNNIRVQLGLELQALKEFGKLLSSEERYRLMAQYIGNEGALEARVIRNDMKWQMKSNNERKVDQIVKEYLKAPITSGFVVPENNLINSTEYLSFLLDKATLEYSSSFQVSYDSLYYFLKANKTGILRNRLLACFINKNSSKLKNFDKIYYDALNTIKDSDDIAIFKNLSSRLQEADAFNFALPDIHGKIVHLSDFKGKTVFIDFWFTGCENCTVFFKEKLEPVELRFKGDNNMVFVTICIDKNRSSWFKSIQSNEYTSQRAINLYTNGEGSANNVVRFYKIHEYPQPLIVTKDQKIYSLDLADLRQKDNLFRTLKKLRQN